VYAGGRNPDTSLHRQRARSFASNLGSQRSAAGASSNGGYQQQQLQQILSGPAAIAGIGASPAAGAALASAGGVAPPPLPQLPPLEENANGGGYHWAPAGSSMGSPAGAAAQPYVSSFGSLPPHLAGSSLKLGKILLTHAPYMSKLESIASSATRWVAGWVAWLIIWGMAQVLGGRKQHC
jgi:hypothetical protein